jgi:WD40-like Beta Propeller Repeat
MTSRALTFCTLATLTLSMPVDAEPARGSITIERIAAIKYPTYPAWSPDGSSIAFLWDAAGKQDLFVVTPGRPPVQLTDFPVDPDLLVSDMGAFAWVSNDEILFGKDGQLWTVSPSTAKPARVSGAIGDAAAFALSPNRSQIAFLRRGQIWLASVAARTERQITRIPEPLAANVPIFSADGRWLAFTASQSSLEPEDLRWNGNLVRSMEAITADRRLGIVSAQGGDVAWVPTMGAVSNLRSEACRACSGATGTRNGGRRQIETPG